MSLGRSSLAAGETNDVAESSAARCANSLRERTAPKCFFIVALSFLPSDEKERPQATQSENARQLAERSINATNRRRSVLFDLCQGAHVQFQRLIVLPLDLKLGLQLLDEQLEVGNFRPQFVKVRRRSRAGGRRRAGGRDLPHR